MMQHEVDKSSPAALMLPMQQQQDTLPLPGEGAAAAAAPCVRPSTSGSSGGSPSGIQRGNASPQSQQQAKPPPNVRTGTNSTLPVQSSPLQQSQVPNRPRTASSSQQQTPAALALQQLARSGTQNSANSAPALPQTPTYSRPNTAALATTPSGGALPALPPSPPLTRSATRSRSSVITATQNQQYVDYLLQNGGLTRPICINFSPQRDPHEIAYTSINGGEIPEVSYAPLNSGNDDANGDKSPLTVFAPLHYSLDAYTQILTNSGSIAVGTGYRSVARRLLERVEALFARDIGLPWGETLEWLRGKRRRERLPALPVLPTKGLLKQNTSTVDGGETPTVLGNNQNAEEPRQQLPPQPVVPLMQPPADGQGVHQMLAEGEKIRTKTKVEEWLDETETVLSTTINNNAAGPVPNSGPMGNGKPNDAAGIFYVNLANQFNGTPQNSQAFNIPQDAASTASQEEEEEKIVSGIVMSLLKESPLQKELYTQYLSDNALLERTMLALRRLYPSFPAHTITRSIAALYLLLHPDLHNVLEAISRITKGELDLLNSGRFDGFLDEKDVIPADEEKELEALEILDGNIFRTMEKLEDEIEALHVRAEEVRRKLRVRKEAIARKMVLAGKDKDSGVLSGGGGAMEQFGGMLSRQNSSASTALVKHVQLPPPPPKSDYFEGLDKESTLNPIFPDDSASNYGSRHRRRTTRKAASSALAGEEGELVRRGSTGSGAAGSAGAGPAAQHLMKKQFEREKDKRDKERTREKFEKERERREKEERRKAKLANAAANIGFHHRALGEGAGAVLPSPPYSVGGEIGGEKEKGLLPGSPLGPKRKKSKEEHKEKEKEKRDRHRSPERPTTSGKKSLENPPSREFDTTGAGTTMVATSPPTLLEDVFAPMTAGKERSAKDKESKKKDKNKEDKEKDKSRKEIDDDQPAPAEDQKDSQDSKRRFSLKFRKFRSSDHENDTSADSVRPGTSGSLRPTTAQSVNTAITSATNATGTAIGPTDVPSSSSGKHRKERKHHSRREAIPEADEDDDDGDEKIIRQHHTTRRKNSRRTAAAPGVQNSTANIRAALEVLSEPEDMFGREEKPSYNFTGVFSEDEGGAAALTAFTGANDLKQQLMSRKGLRGGSESKGAGAGGEISNEPAVKEKSKDKEKEKDRKTREHREERRERKRLEREEAEELEKEKAQLRFSIGMSHASSNAGLPMFPLLSSQPPSAPGSHLGDILPSSVALPRLSVAMSDDPSRAESAVSDNTPSHNHKSRKGKEKEKDRDRDHRDKDRDRKPEYKPSFSSSTGGASGHGPTGGVSLLGLEANEHGYGADGLLTSTYVNGGVKEGNLNSATAATTNNINNLNLNNNNSGMMDAEVMTLGEGTTMVGEASDEVGSLPGISRTSRLGGIGGGQGVGAGGGGEAVGGPGDRLSLDFFNGID